MEKINCTATLTMPLPRAFRCPVGGLQITLRFRVKLESLGAFKVSKMDGPLGPGCCSVVSLSTGSEIASERSAWASASASAASGPSTQLTCQRPKVDRKYCAHAHRINKPIIQVSKN